MTKLKLTMNSIGGIILSLITYFLGGLDSSLKILFILLVFVKLYIIKKLIVLLVLKESLKK